MKTRHYHTRLGFTLVEVLVALTIVAVALLACMRAVTQMTQTNADLKLRLLAQLSAQNSVAQLRLARAFPDIGSRTESCPQANVPLECEQVTTATPNSFFRRVTVRVYEAPTQGTNSPAPSRQYLAELVMIAPRNL